ncbi:MAG TPA: bifunctional DNA primase/polymerase [Nannocystaceae bacterium]|nr:bifunctional DNA primase/polymerase [Nannocystaceae bacterium]
MHRTDSNWMSAARRLLASGVLAPIPLCRPTSNGCCSAARHTQPCLRSGKRPLVVGYPAFATRPPSDSQLREWDQRFPNSNLGGVVRNDFIVVEADSPTAESEVLLLDPRLAASGPSRERRRGRGRAWVLSTAAGSLVRNRAHLGQSHAIDVRAPGGLLVVEPSLHVSGDAVQWVPGREPWTSEPLVLDGALAALVLPVHERATVRGPASVASIAPGPSARVMSMIRAHLDLRRLWDGEGRSRGDASASGYDFALARALLSRHVPVPEVVDAVMHRPGRHRDDADYAHRTVEAARRGGVR